MDQAKLPTIDEIVDEHLLKLRSARGVKTS